MTAPAMIDAQNTSQDTSAPYEVGYGKPPRHTQFRKGQSGNPGGRPRRQPVQRANALLLAEAYRCVAIKVDGRMVPVTALQAILRSQIELAINGNYRAQRDILKGVQHLEFMKSLGAYNETYVEDKTDVDDETDQVGETDEVGESGEEDESGQENESRDAGEKRRRRRNKTRCAVRRESLPVFGERRRARAERPGGDDTARQRSPTRCLRRHPPP